MGNDYNSGNPGLAAGRAGGPGDREISGDGAPHIALKIGEPGYSGNYDRLAFEIELQNARYKNRGLAKSKNRHSE